MAAMLRSTFEADGASIRLSTPRLSVTEGDARPDTSDEIAPETETIDDQRVLVAPIGRASDPLGEVRLYSQHAGAFGSRERAWLTAFLLPVGAALRARRREQLLRERAGTLARDVFDAAGELQHSLGRLPANPRDDGLAVPPAVDASEVLGQLSDGLEGVTRRSDDLEVAAMDARTRIRDASDEVAQALDALRTFTNDLLRLGTWNDAIAASNQSVSGVAFRTNLLANNAALEATRAGSAGKTFGVLAEEIRRLADATASSSSAIEDATRALAEELASRVAALEAVQTSLVAAIRESETGEDAARQVADTAGVVLSHARSLKPAVEEAYAVAKRRSARDDKLTTTTERLLEERNVMAAALSEHRTAVDRVREVLERLGRGPGSGRR
jgi:chromosome segregation ATPase